MALDPGELPNLAGVQNEAQLRAARQKAATRIKELRSQGKIGRNLTGIAEPGMFTEEEVIAAFLNTGTPTAREIEILGEAPVSPVADAASKIDAEFRDAMKNRTADESITVWNRLVDARYGADPSLVSQLRKTGPPPLGKEEIKDVGLFPDQAAKDANTLVNQQFDNFKSTGGVPVSVYLQIRDRLSPESQAALDSIWVVNADGKYAPDGDTGGQKVFLGSGDGASGSGGSSGGGGLMSEYQRIQIEIARGTLDLNTAKDAWDRVKDQWTQERNARIDAQAKLEYDRAVFESDRTAKLNLAGNLLSGRLTMADLVNRATLEAQKYAAPSTEYLPGQEPGGVMSKLSGFSGAKFSPVRTEDVRVPFDPKAVAEQALAEYEASAGKVLQ